jgi:hypothetical protein
MYVQAIVFHVAEHAGFVMAGNMSCISPAATKSRFPQRALALPADKRLPA